MFPNDQKQSRFKLQSLGQTGALRSQENNSHSQSLLWEKIIIIIWTRVRILCNRITTALSLGRKWCLSGDIIMIMFSRVDSWAGWLGGASLHPDWGQGRAHRGGQQGWGLCQAQLCGSVRQVRERGDYVHVLILNIVRVTYYLDWIKEHAAQGACAYKHRVVTGDSNKDFIKKIYSKKYGRKNDLETFFISPKKDRVNGHISPSGL